MTYTILYLWSKNSKLIWSQCYKIPFILANLLYELEITVQPSVKKHKVGTRISQLHCYSRWTVYFEFMQKDFMILIYIFHDNAHFTYFVCLSIHNFLVLYYLEYNHSGLRLHQRSIILFFLNTKKEVFLKAKLFYN